MPKKSKNKKERRCKACGGKCKWNPIAKIWEHVNTKRHPVKL